LKQKQTFHFLIHGSIIVLFIFFIAASKKGWINQRNVEITYAMLRRFVFRFFGAGSESTDEEDPSLSDNSAWSSTKVAI
jgi:hypothetical protein